MSNTITRDQSNGRMSKSVEHANVIYLSGQVGDPQSNISDQTREVLGKIEDLLASAGSDKNRILSATIWLSDMDDFAAMNEVWDAWVSAGQEPARACGEAKLACPELKVEIMIIAAKL